MREFLVTVKMIVSPGPKPKVSGVCPFSGRFCTDIHGAHHSTLVRTLSMSAAKDMFSGFHITRIEEVS